MVAVGYLRSLIAILFAVFFFIIGIPVSLVLWILAKIFPDKRDRFVFGFVDWGLSVEYHIAGAKVEVIGRENIPKDRAVLFVGNHRSIYDVIIGVPVLGIPVSPIAKIELAKVPFLHYWMKQIGAQFLDRSDIKAGVQMIQDSVEMIKNGRSVLIYPEGTRNHTEGTIQEFKGGSFKIAIRSGCDVIPLTMIGTGDIFEDHFAWLKAKKITMVVGEPIPTKGMSIQDRKLLHTRCHDLMLETYRKYSGEGEK